MQLHYASRSPAAINPTDYFIFQILLAILILVPASLKNRKVKFFTIFTQSSTTSS